MGGIRRGGRTSVPVGRMGIVGAGPYVIFQWRDLLWRDLLRRSPGGGGPDEVTRLPQCRNGPADATG
ncbi:hypothetical protein Shyd_15670 [Streptomyces hydrogenans]|uniref:Uncharacterized protein n=1 Tax=Streptomyces hydrogenans TaxID=1873719 RepID=A0ABQ3P599_9ACTN|nr:hypothetical protein GCM10018784_76030 [Streptomyces hydrogenans]GHI20196.1 hypothetical protein Shyd_15670 [Streptomyces hydrogenans]